MNQGLETQNLSVGYRDLIILDDLSIKIPLGKITAIIGPNGCGKSTFLKAVGRILEVKKGCVYLDCKDIHQMHTKELAQKMAILPQSPIAPEGITVEELVSYGRFPYQKGMGRLNDEDKRIVDWALNSTNLEDIRFQLVENLSGGQRQRVWIALALAQETQLILLDEPTTYLDMAYQLEVLELLDDLNKTHGCTIVMVLHDLNLAAKFSDYMIAFRDGKVICADTPNSVMTKENLRSVYNINANIMEDPNCNRPICISYQLLNHKTYKNDIQKKKEE